MTKDRRTFLRALPAVGMTMGLAACGGRASPVDEKSGALGASRTVTWAVGTTGSDFVTEISTGAADAAEMLGWRFRRVLNAQATPDAHVTAIKQAVTARSDVVLTVDWYQAVVDEIKAAKKQGVHFAIVNSANNPEALAPLNVPFVGQEPRATGRLMGERIASALADKSLTQGVVLVGNPFPGSVNVEERIQGIGDGLTANGQHYRMVTFPDNAASDSATAVGLYKAKIAEAGNVVAHAVAGGEMSVVPLTKALSELNAQAQSAIVGSWGSSLKTLTLVKNGEIDFALDENLYYQGFMAVLLVWSQLERNMPAVSISAGHSWIMRDNVEEMIKSYERRKAAAVAYGLS